MSRLLGRPVAFAGAKLQPARGARVLIGRRNRNSSRLPFLAELFETWIISQRIEHRIEAKQCRSKRHVCRKPASVRYREQFLQSVYGTVGFARFRGHSREDIERNWTI